MIKCEPRRFPVCCGFESSLRSLGYSPPAGGFLISSFTSINPLVNTQSNFLGGCCTRQTLTSAKLFNIHLGLHDRAVCFVESIPSPQGACNCFFLAAV